MLSNESFVAMSNQTREESRWTRAIENAQFGVWDLDLGLDMVHYSPDWKRRLGFPRIHVPDSTSFWRCRVHPDDFDPMLKSLRSHLEGHSPTYEMRFRLRSNGSGYRTMLSRGRVVARDDLGNATRMIGTMLDLTGRPVSLTNHGLAAEALVRADKFARPPFHAALGGARAVLASCSPENGDLERGQTGRAQESHRLIERVDDLLDIALREASAAG